MTLTEKYRERIDSVLKIQQETVMDNSGVSHGLIEKQDGSLVMLAFTNDFMESAQSRNKLAAAMLAQMVKFEAKYAIFCSDTWYAKLPAGMDRSGLPESMNDWPPELREEAIICVVNQFGCKGECSIQAYTRDGHGKPIFAALETPNEMKFNRFVFDLSEEHLIDLITKKQSKGAQS